MNNTTTSNGITSFIQLDMESAQDQRFLNGQATIYTTRMPDKETVNEDAAALIPYDKQSGVLLVADGLGGTRGGEEAARIAVESLSRTVTQSAKEASPLREAILNGIDHANKTIMALGSGAATTLALIELQQGKARPYHVGDSMILICGQRGRIKFQAIPHSPVGYAVEAGLLDEKEAVHHEERHIVSNVVGSPEMRIDIGPVIKLSQHDTIAIASDGLSDNLFIEEIIEAVRKGPLDNAATELEKTTHERMTKTQQGQPNKPDDLSFVLYRPS